MAAAIEPNINFKSSNKRFPLHNRIAHIAIVVEDYDKAIKYYTERLDFQLLEDTKLGESKRWVLVAPSGAQECSILLAKAADKKQSEIIGAQTGGRVSFFLFADDFERDYQKFKKRGVVFVRPPKEEVYGTAAVFKDLYGNLWDLLEPSPDNKGLLGKGDVKSKKPMQPKSVNFGTLLESVEDWIRNGLSGNRIVAKIVDASKSIEAIIDGAYFVENDNRIYLVIRRREQEDLYDDAGNLLNDESPSGIYKDLQELEESGVNYSTPIEIEIWFSDEEDELQYRLECHQYYFSKNKLSVVHYLGREENGYEQEFRKLLHEQYYP